MGNKERPQPPMVSRIQSKQAGASSDVGPLSQSHRFSHENGPETRRVHPTFCRFTTHDDDDQSWNNRKHSPSRTPPAKRPAPNPLPPAFPKDGLHLMGHHPKPDNSFQYNSPHTQAPHHQPPKNLSMSASSHKRPPPSLHQTTPTRSMKILCSKWSINARTWKIPTANSQPDNST